MAASSLMCSCAGRLEALATRAVYAELVALAEARDGSDAVGVWSGGVWWEMR